ncbi:MAG: DUF3576 domain-containing protein [Janthinobacterium lividum]
MLKLFLLVSCYISVTSYADDYPKTIQERKNDEIGSILDGKGLIFTPGRIKNESTKSDGGKSNKFLWQAAVETMNFVPLQSSDSAGGIIITDWYSPKSQPTYSFKINIFIKDNVISPDSIEVKVYERRLKNNQWIQDQRESKIGGDLERKILNRARDLYIKTK